MGSQSIPDPTPEDSKDPWTQWFENSSHNENNGQANKGRKPSPKGSTSTASAVTAGPSQRRPGREFRNEGSSSRRSRWSGASWRWSSWSSSANQKKKAVTRSWIPSYKRCTYPPCSRVLKGEMQRLTRPKKKGGLRSASRQKHRQGRKKSRHSLADVLSSFVHASSSSDSSAGPPYASVRSSMILQLTDPDLEVTRHYCPVHDDGNTDGKGSNSVRLALARRPKYGNDNNWLAQWTQWQSRRFSRRQQQAEKTKSSVAKVQQEPVAQLPLFRFPTISSISSKSTMDVQFQTDEKPQRFSAFWYDGNGRSGKRLVEVNQKLGMAYVEVHSSVGQKYMHHVMRCISAQYSLFLFGFLFFPIWWIGAILHVTRPPISTHIGVFSPKNMLTPRTAGQLNCWMSALSVFLLGIIIALAVWYQTRSGSLA